MGLDNGINLKLKKNSCKLPKFIKCTETKHYNRNGRETQYVLYELAYWRKCWSLRNDILSSVKNLDMLTTKDINDIIKVIKKYYFTLKGINCWFTSGMNYWEYTYRTSLEGLAIIRNLYWVKHFMKHHKCRVYFYDSY